MRLNVTLWTPLAVHGAGWPRLSRGLAIGTAGAKHGVG